MSSRRWLLGLGLVAVAFAIESGCAFIVDLGPERTLLIATDVTTNDNAAPENDAATDVVSSDVVLTSDGGVGNGVVVSVAAMWHDGCALFENGTVYCWGGNDFGQLGRPPAASDPICVELDGTKHHCLTTPVPVLGVADVAQIGSGGTDFTCALKKDGTVWCWGRNQHGQTGSTFDQECELPAPNGTVGAPTRCNPNPQLVALPAKAKELSLSSATTCALLENGDVWCWGFNDGARAGVPLQSPTVSPFDARKHPPTKVAIPGEAGPIAHVGASSGTNTTCATSVNKGVWCWGKAHLGQAGRIPATVGPAQCDYCSHIPGAARDTNNLVLSGAIDTASGTATCIRRSDQTAACFGHNAWGELGQGYVDSIVGNGAHYKPLTVPIPTPIAALAARYNQVFATDAAGDVWVWGRNDQGTLGDGTTGGTACQNGKLACVTTPKKNPLLAGMIQIVPGSYSVIARKADNTVWMWGNNVQGQLGHAPKTSGDTPVCTDDPCNPAPSQIVLPKGQ